jgi:hypothetical protein
MRTEGIKPDKTFEILMIEDNRADARLIVDAWEQCNVVNKHPSLGGLTRRNPLSSEWHGVQRRQ